MRFASVTDGYPGRQLREAIGYHGASAFAALSATFFSLPSLAQVRAVPNLLTLLRLFILPFLVIQIFDDRWVMASILFVLAGISDGLDGLLARRLDQHTKLGQYLDPIADKLMLSTLFLVLTHVGLIPRYVTVLVFSRDLGILLISTLLFVTNVLRDFRPSVFGKLSTATQIVAVIVVFCGELVGGRPLTEAREILLRAVAVLAPVSAAQYAWVVLRRVHASPGGAAAPAQQ